MPDRRASGDPAPFRSGAPPAVLVLFALDVAFVTGYLAHVAMGEPSAIWKAILDVNGEWNPPAVYSAAQLAVLAAGLWAFDRGEAAATRAERVALLALPGLALFFALDELAQIHEGLGTLSDRLLPGGTRERTIVSRTGIWALLLGPPLAAALGWVVWVLRSRLRDAPRARRRLLAGAVVFLASAVGLELASNFVRTWPLQAVQHAVEELGEMAGVTLLVWGAHELLRARNRRWPGALHRLFGGGHRRS